MTKIINIFIFIEIFVIVITYFHLIKQYKYVLYRYNKQKNRKKQREVSKENIVTSNMTQSINTDELNEVLNLPILNFSLCGKKIKEIPIKNEKIFIGRAKSDDIIIDEPTISRNQCMITRENGKYFINIDINKNPIQLNKEKIPMERERPFKEELLNGDIVSMGNGKISFKFVLFQDNIA